MSRQAATLRSVGRRLVSAIGGPAAEEALHARWHELLVATRRFSPPEDEETLALLRAAARRSMTLIDVGANIGLYTRFLCANAARGAALYAFEPNADAFRLLRRNVRTFDNVECFEMALGASDESASLDVPTDAAGNPVSGLGRIVPAVAGAGSRMRTVSVRSLDRLVEAGLVNAAGPAFLKIDVEGAESAVLRGASNFLRRLQPIVYYECEQRHLQSRGESAEAVWEVLRDAGAAILRLEKDILIECPTASEASRNYFAVPRALLEGASAPLPVSVLVARMNTQSTIQVST